MARKKKGCALCKDGCEECPLFRRGVRLVGIEQRQETVEACVFHVLADNVEALHRKVSSMQAEVGEMKNTALFQALAILGKPEGETELLKIIRRNVDERLHAIPDS